MNLHRIEGAPEWANVPAGQRNVWQRLAARTHGIVTIGNFLSLLGLASIPLGLQFIGDEHYDWAVAALALGRLCDLLDGWLADKTHTKSPLGEKIDASFDKVSTAAVLIGLVAINFTEPGVAVFLALPHLLIAVLALVAYKRGTQLHPSVLGKISMAAIWGAILLAISLSLIPIRFEDIGKLALLATAYGSAFLGFMAFINYLLDFNKADAD